uniref:SET domain containing (Lysine methyltransferase) 7 [Monodelphis domestica] n=1 Tax=Lepeophtheirus salmonis TaxID=72036 RepID=A0A0K2T4L7_LEPSM
MLFPRSQFIIMPDPRAILFDYLTTFSNPSSNHKLQQLQDSKQEDFDTSFLQDSNKIQEEEEPLSFEGSLKNGWCKAMYKDNRTLEGFYHEGVLVGNALETQGDVLTLYYCKKGIKHGFTRSLRKLEDGSYRLENLGTYINGTYEGFRWKGVEGGGYYLLQEGSLKAAFIYPDLQTVMLGNLNVSHPQGPILSSPIIASIRGISWIDGILVPHFQPNEIQNPLEEDPFERKYVAVRISNIPNAGEGLFTKSRVHGHGQILAYFNGKKDLIPSNSEYSIRLDEQTILDIPHEWLASGYRATLGHKVCHSFEPNAEYSYTFHPLYGRIRCIKSLKALSADEEIKCNYKYSLKKKPPAWYIDALQVYMDNLILSDEDRQLLKNMLEN